MHTLNIRYFPEQLIYTVNHAEDEAVFVDRSLLPLFAKYLAELETVQARRRDGRRRRLPNCPTTRASCGYDEVVGGAEPIDFTDRVTDERQGAAICYTTGTTGNPKGVLYSHRSMWLHSNAAHDDVDVRAERVATGCCRSSRCSTPTRGGCPTRRSWPARRWSCPARTCRPKR